MTAFIFLLQLMALLDDPEAGVSYDGLLIPLLICYSTMLICYVVVSSLLSRLPNEPTGAAWGPQNAEEVSFRNQPVTVSSQPLRNELTGIVRRASGQDREEVREVLYALARSVAL
jgi:hypothetical protein